MAPGRALRPRGRGKHTQGLPSYQRLEARMHGLERKEAELVELGASFSTAASMS